MTPILSCHSINKFYGRKHILKDITLDIYEGEVIALIGANGAGKTTLMNAIAGFAKLSSGHISMLNNKTSQLLGLLPQDALLEGAISIGDQLKYFARLQGLSKRQAETEVEKVLTWVGLQECQHAMIKQLSHGMKKRISIAQAIMGEPSIVLLDEPTAGLDPENALKIREIINQLKSKITFIISSHNLDELEKLCDRMIMMEEGKVIRDEVLAEAHDLSTLIFSLDKSHNESFRHDIQQIESVREVRFPKIDEVVVEYFPNKSSDFDVERRVFEIFTKYNFRYKTINQGRTLEDRLYGSHS